MFGILRKRTEAALRASILADVREMLSLDKVDASGHPNLRPLQLATRNLELANLNLKFFGYQLAREIAAAIPADRVTAARHVGLGSKPSTQVDMEADWVSHWCRELGVPVVMHRKLWELSYVLQALHEHGMLRDGARGLGFGCGAEPIPSFLAARGVAVTATDLGPDEAAAAGWVATGQHARTLDAMFHPHLVAREPFDRLVELEVVDMNAVPPALAAYDFCWSICALEHLGSIERGLAFVERSVETLRPGGIAVHTTEYNIASDGPTIDNWPTVLFQRGHLLALADRLAAKGHRLATLDFDIGDGPMDRFIDLPPWSHNLPDELQRWHGDGQHLKVGVDGFASTCFGLIAINGG